LTATSSTRSMEPSPVAVRLAAGYALASILDKTATGLLILIGLQIAPPTRPEKILTAVMLAGAVILGHAFEKHVEASMEGLKPLQALAVSRRQAGAVLRAAGIPGIILVLAGLLLYSSHALPGLLAATIGAILAGSARNTAAKTVALHGDLRLLALSPLTGFFLSLLVAGLGPGLILVLAVKQLGGALVLLGLAGKGGGLPGFRLEADAGLLVPLAAGAACVVAPIAGAALFLAWSLAVFRVLWGYPFYTVFTVVYSVASYLASGVWGLLVFLLLALPAGLPVLYPSPLRLGFVL